MMRELAAREAIVWFIFDVNQTSFPFLQKCRRLFMCLPELLISEVNLIMEDWRARKIIRVFIALWMNHVVLRISLSFMSLCMQRVVVWVKIHYLPCHKCPMFHFNLTPADSYSRKRQKQHRAVFLFRTADSVNYAYFMQRTSQMHTLHSQWVRYNAICMFPVLIK